MDNGHIIIHCQLLIINCQKMLNIESNTENADSSLLDGSYGYNIRRA